MQLLGQGGVWKIYRIDNEKSVFRIPKGFAEISIQTFIKNYKFINSIGIPTLERVEKFELNGKIGIKCDNVNFPAERVYVTYNSLYSDSHKYLDLLSTEITGNKKKREVCLAEEFRYRNKIVQITNFKEFILDVKSDIKLATKRDVLIEFDSYFFGTQRQNSVSSIDYKIVDLDHIFTKTCKNEVDLYGTNFSEFKRAISGFLKYFVTDENRNKYIDELEE